jgi:hypothetical protein
VRAHMDRVDALRGHLVGRGTTMQQTVGVSCGALMVVRSQQLPIHPHTREDCLPCCTAYMDMTRNINPWVPGDRAEDSPLCSAPAEGIGLPTAAIPSGQAPYAYEAQMHGMGQYRMLVTQGSCHVCVLRLSLRPQVVPS